MRNIKISLVAFLVATSLLVVSPAKVSAGAWGESAASNFGSVAMGRMMEVLYDQIQAALVQALKQAAIEMITDTINNMIAGTTEAGAMFITDWEDYLFNGPKTQTSLYMNDFFSITAQGRTGANYRSNCGSSFSDWRTSYAKNRTEVRVDLSNLKSDFEDVACDAAEMFEDGTWEAFDRFLRAKNNPTSFSMIANGVMEERERKFQKQAEVQSVAYQGFIATYSDDGKIVLTPGSTIKDIESHVNELPGDALVNAQRPGEIVGAIVGQLVGTVIKQGIGNIQGNIQSQINQQICNASGLLEDELSRFAPSGEGGFGYGVGSLGETSGDECNLN